MLSEQHQDQRPLNKPGSKMEQDIPRVYQIRIEGHLGSQWTDWFGGLSVTLEDNGDTLLTGPVIDQAALHGLLKKVRDLGMPLISVLPVQSGPVNLTEENSK
jgi:hypothetical protein